MYSETPTNTEAQNVITADICESQGIFKGQRDDCKASIQIESSQNTQLCSFQTWVNFYF